MKQLLKILLLLGLASQAIAQEKPVYERSRTDQVLSDRATWSRYFMAIPHGATPAFPAYVPDSLKNGALFNKTGSSPGLYVYNGSAWILVGSGGGGSIDTTTYIHNQDSTAQDADIFISGGVVAKGGIISGNYNGGNYVQLQSNAINGRDTGSGYFRMSTNILTFSDTLRNAIWNMNVAGSYGGITSIDGITKFNDGLQVRRDAVDPYDVVNKGYADANYLPIGSVSTNIYNTDGTLTGGRNINLNNNTLNIEDLASTTLSTFNVNATGFLARYYDSNYYYSLGVSTSGSGMGVTDNSSNITSISVDFSGIGVNDAIFRRGIVGTAYFGRNGGGYAYAQIKEVDSTAKAKADSVSASQAGKRPYILNFVSSGGSVNAEPNTTNIIYNSGSISTVNIVYPASPSDGDIVYLSFSNPVTTITYSGGTKQGGGRISAVAGDQAYWTYNSSGGFWY